MTNQENLSIVLQRSMNYVLVPRISKIPSRQEHNSDMKIGEGKGWKQLVFSAATLTVTFVFNFFSSLRFCTPHIAKIKKELLLVC
jgi:hypothetical protein